MCSTERRPNPSPTQQINIFNGSGWDDDCDDDADYVDMAPLTPSLSKASSQPSSPRYPKDSKHQTPNRLDALRPSAPNVVVLPASPHGSPKASNAGSVISTDTGSSSGSNTDSDSDYDDYLTKNLPHKRDRGANTSEPSRDVIIDSPPQLPERPQSSIAGQAARIYLQAQNTVKAKISNDLEAPKSPSGLQRSSSRVGTRGVQGRVVRSRAQASVRSRSTNELTSDADGDAGVIDRARMKSRTLDRSLSGLKHSDGGEINAGDSKQLKVNDGAAVIGMISDRRRKSQSLDAKYLQYLDGVSKHASAPNSPKTTLDKKKRSSKEKKRSKKKKGEPSEEIDEEEEFRRYQQAMTSRAARSPHAASTPDLSLSVESSIGMNLSEFVKERGKKGKKTGLVGRFSMRKSKTAGKLLTDSLESNPDPAETVEGQKSNSLKKEKRKSWRKKAGFSIKPRSKERTNSDPMSPPISPPPDEYSLITEPHRKSTKTPQIKQTLGYNGSNSPSLRLKNGAAGDNRLRNNDSLDRDEPDSRHSPRIMSRTLDNRNASALTHPKLKQVSSWNAENSGSGSDLSLVVEDDYTGRSGTLTRLLSRKPKKLDGVEYDYGEPGYGSLGRKKTKRGGKYATVGSPMMARKMKEASRERLEDIVQPVDPVTRFLNASNFSHGFKLHLEEDSSDDYEDSELNEIGLTFESAGVNKYATITGAKPPGYWNYDSGKKRGSDPAVETCPDPPVMHKRNKSLPVVEMQSKAKNGKGRAKNAANSRHLLRSTSSSPVHHLPFSEMLPENDQAYSGMDHLSLSPLRTRKLHAIEPLLEEPSETILAAARTLYRCLVGTTTELLRTHFADEGRDTSCYDTTLPEGDVSPSFEDSVFGSELVSWLVEQMPSAHHESAEAKAEKRTSACGMFQALVEEGALSHVRREHHFQDSSLLYQFHDCVKLQDRSSACKNGRPVSRERPVSSVYNSDAQSMASEIDDSSCRTSRASSIQSGQTVSSDSAVPSIVDEQELKEVLAILQNVAPDAMFRMVLRKLPDDRTMEELTMIYEEILHIKALSHLSDSVKRQLAGVLKFEFHRKRDKTLFSQGDEGRSWYIIIKGSVDVDIQGQGVVCTLHEGDDFGNLAIINDAPRAATIVLAEDNCQLLRVDKHDFVRILKDVEANTVRLKEHEKDVLVLQKIHARASSSSPGRHDKFTNNNTKTDPRIPVAATPTRHNHRYAISAGTPSKIVEHVVKSLKPWSTAKQTDEAMEDLILMYQVFLSTQDICKYLMNLYHSEKAEQIDATKSIKRKVVYFVVRWSHIATHIFYDQPAIGPFLKELKQAVQDDEKIYPTLKEDLARIFVYESGSSESPNHRGWLTVDSITIHRYPSTDAARTPHKGIRATDDVMLKVYNVANTYTTVKLPVLSTVSEIISAVAEKQGRDPEELRLIQVQSDGDMYGFPDDMTSAATALGVNSRLFACTKEEKDSISPLDEQRTVPCNNGAVLELVGSQEIAEHVTQFDWELVNSIHVMEFVHKVFGSHKFHSVTSNIDVFARRFNQLAYWAPTEICACNNINKRVHLLRKFIKIAQHLKELQNMNGFMAVMIGLGNQALSRLHSTWDKLPTKYKKLMSEFEAVLDPSRNHRAYRLHVATLRPPMIPYLPLLMKDMTFQHEGNDNVRNGLINFEKMHMMSNSIRGVVHACCKPFQMTHTAISSKSFDETRQYSRNFDVITDQKLLNTLSGKIEAKR